ncbi:hypothetical protein BOX15_Mlig017743g1 [Macrostomum lignano]|uniref:ER membrane protein complex subunit 10 n=1 Tax=Macrostomum lignano TaxID=282301 RepID=A0A267E862_9PLAT|nr:hypothetical protein BOX15_Mlig017743g1 [Macrostomum lignano]
MGLKDIITFAFAAILFSVYSTTAQSINDDEFGQVLQFTLEHELVKGKFTKRGILSVHSYSSEHVLYRDEAPLTDEDVLSLIKLAEARDIYRARVLFKVGNKVEYVYGFVYACDLLHSGLRDNLTLAFNSHGSLVGLHLSLTDSSKAAFESCTVKSGHLSPASLPRVFISHAAALRPVQGPAPETQIYIARVEEEKKRKHEAEQGDNRPLVMKYWMYIVPVVLVFMVMSAQDPNAQGGGGS